MFEEPKRIPYQTVHDSSEPHDMSQEIDCEEYGEDYEPMASVRVSNVPQVHPDTDKDTDEGY